ncbi:Nucleotidyltransferase domain protein [Pseudodesulfovibrio hydrargyri]|uniref:Nucleotidyltransferase domain protein n=1 Tax=Pseudodesulfovibrio hydrargyri TaxID=2125990 RepID=A0A1J5MSW7_9BACT|nr:nucleotidyltransferase domain-containing protein [Pseudodesulfovibrio hydrargyri]OIQ48964.1 Nucleotidyltransferase domain protein [Pseudodesulfovibrio hydrargyri]
MIEAQTWVSEILSKLREAFGTRLRYLGLQGSYRREEASESSDIDLVVLLDTVELDDLDAYRAVVHTMPEGHKACGFLCGVREFAAWPPHELFAFAKDTADHFGRLDDYLPPITHDDVRHGAKINASALLHMLTHSYLYADKESTRALLKEAFKAAFFLMQVVHYLDSGQYRASKRELLADLDGAQREIIEAGMDFPGWLEARSERQAFEMLLGWCRDVMCEA